MNKNVINEVDLAEHVFNSSTFETLAVGSLRDT